MTIKSAEVVVEMSFDDGGNIDGVRQETSAIGLGVGNGGPIAGRRGTVSVFVINPELGGSSLLLATVALKPRQGCQSASFF